MKWTEYYGSFKWIKVKRHRDDSAKTWEEQYRELEKHHLEETAFLIDEVRTLARILDEHHVERGC